MERVSKPALLLAFGGLAVGCALVSGLADYDVVDQPSATNDAAPNAPALANVVDSGFDAGLWQPVDPSCDPNETPSGLFVSTAGLPTNDGSAESPLGSVQSAITQLGDAGGAPKIYVEEGTYTEAIVVTTASSFAIEGGWKHGGAAWQKDCSPDVIGKTTIASPSHIGALVAKGTLGLRRLTILSKNGDTGDGGPGESTYGLWASAGAQVSLELCDVRPGGGGVGGVGPAAGAASTPSCNGTTCADGQPGTTGSVGEGAPDAGHFSDAGYIAVNGVLGGGGATGRNGAAGPAGAGGTCAASCTLSVGGSCTATNEARTGGTGHCGCGGGGGGAGGFGFGGGGSFAVFAQGASTNVTTKLTRLLGGAGGAGGAGGPGGAGKPGTNGGAGSATPCPTSCLASSGGFGGEVTCGASGDTTLAGGSAGGAGGAGGTGGPGGGGAGGSSYGAVQIDGALVASDSTSLLISAGAGSGGSASASAGATNAHLP